MSDRDRETDESADGRETQPASDNETILMALDQISQTIDVMTSIVGRLRHFVEEQEFSEEAAARDALRPGRTLH